MFVNVKTSQQVVSPTTQVARNAETLIELATAQPFDSYGSIEGILRRVTVDDRERHEASDLQVIDRMTDQIVECSVSPSTAEAMAPLIRHRVVVFGNIRFSADHLPQRIRVESFEAIDAEQVLSLEEIQKLHFSVPDGEDAADFISQMRGDDD